MSVSAGDSHKAANVKGIFTGVLKFTQMRVTNMFVNCRKGRVITGYPLRYVLNGNTQGFTKSISLFYESSFIHCVESVNKLFISGVVSLFLVFLSLYAVLQALRVRN
jgi:hypothetical protein